MSRKKGIKNKNRSLKSWILFIMNNRGGSFTAKRLLMFIDKPIHIINIRLCEMGRDGILEKNKLGYNLKNKL